MIWIYSVAFIVMSINAAYFLEEKKINNFPVYFYVELWATLGLFGKGSLYNSESALSEDACLVVSQAVTFSFFGKTF